MALRKCHRIYRGSGKILCRACYANKRERTIDKPSFRHSLSTIGHRDFLNMTQFAGFLASSQGMRPARSRRKDPAQRAKVPGAIAKEEWKHPPPWLSLVQALSAFG